MVLDLPHYILGIGLQSGAREHHLDAGLLCQVQRLQGIFKGVDVGEVYGETSLLELFIAIQSGVLRRNAVPGQYRDFGFLNIFCSRGDRCLRVLFSLGIFGIGFVAAAAGCKNKANGQRRKCLEEFHGKSISAQRYKLKIKH